MFSVFNFQEASVSDLKFGEVPSLQEEFLLTWVGDGWVWGEVHGCVCSEVVCPGGEDTDVVMKGF